MLLKATMSRANDPKHMPTISSAATGDAISNKGLAAYLGHKKKEYYFSERYHGALP